MLGKKTGVCLSPPMRAAQRRKPCQVQAEALSPCCWALLHAQGGHTDHPQMPAPAVPDSHQLLFASFPSSIPCLGRHLSRHGSSTSNAVVPLCLLQPWTCSLPPSFIPKVVRTSPSADHSFSIISQLTKWQWLSMVWGASKLLTVQHIKNPADEWTAPPEKLQGASRTYLERAPLCRKKGRASAKADRRQWQYQCW